MILNVPIQIRNGLAAAMPASMLEGELYIQNDTGHLYAGLGSGQSPLQLSGGTGAVSSVFGRTGAVTAEGNDYSDVESLVFGDGHSTITFAGASGLELAGPFITLTDGVGSEIDLDGTGDVILTAEGGAVLALGFEGDQSFALTGQDAAITTDSNGNQITIAGTLFDMSGVTEVLAPTPATSDDSTKVATTAYVRAQGYLTTNAVSSVFGRTGAVVAVSGDYSFSEISGTATNAQLAHSSVTVDGDGTVLSSSGVSISLGSSGSLSLLNQAKNTALMGPSSGGNAVPTFRGIATADLPTGIPNANLANASLTIDGDGTVLSSSGVTISLGNTGSLSLATQSANLVLAGPTTGSAVAPTFRSLVVGDLPGSIPNSKLANSTITINGDGTILSSPGSTALGGTAAFSFNNQSANLVLAGPTTGSATTPAFRSLVVGDFPTSGTWAFGGTISGNTTFTGSCLSTNTETFGLVNYTAAVASSPSVVFAGSYENASTPTYAEDSWTLQDVVGSGLNGTSTLQLTHAGTTGTAAFGITNTTAATSSTTNATPYLAFNANYWTGSASALDQWAVNTSLAAGTNGASTLAISHSGSSGAAYFDIHTLNSTLPSLIFDGDTTSGFSRYHGAAGYLAMYVASGAFLGLYAGGTLEGQLGCSSSGNGSVNFGAYQTNGQTTLGTFQSNSCTALQTFCMINPTSNFILTGTGSGTQVGTSVGGSFQPSSGSTAFVCFEVNPTIDQTSSATGNYTALLVDVTETAFLGTTAKLLDLQVGNTSKFYVDHSGNIITSAGGMALDGATNEGAGTINIPGAYYSNAVAGVTQTAEAVGTLATTGGIVTTFTAVSDARLKDSTPYTGGLQEILAINPVRYRWNKEGQKLSGQSGDKDYIGFIAQNVQAQIPEAVWQSQKHEYLCFEDRPVIAALVNAVKTLAARLERLEGRAN